MSISQANNPTTTASNTTTDGYMEAYFREFTPQGMLDMLAPGVRRTAARVTSFFDCFMSARFPGQYVTPSHIFAFMFFRVIGEPLSQIPQSGACQLSTFLFSELGALVHSLNRDRRISFTVQDLKRLPEYHRNVEVCKRYFGEKIAFTHARPIWPQDEVRLRASLTMDTASKRDEALLVLLLRSGFRAASITSIRHDELHVLWFSHTVQVTCPDVKTSNNADSKVLLTGDDAAVVTRWIIHRRMIFPESPLLFITKDGGPMGADHVSEMVRELSMAAGYGYGFFSAHSCRAGYANRVAAEIYARGGSHREVLDRLTDGRNWDLASFSVNSYLQPNVRNFIGAGRMTVHQFFMSSPKLIHGLRDLGQINKRPLDWFCHSETRLRRICSNLDIPWPGCQRKAREKIGSIFVRNARFRDFFYAVDRNCRRSCFDVLAQIVGILLEEDHLDITRCFGGPDAVRMFECLIVDRLLGSRVQRAIHAESTSIHDLRDRDHAAHLCHVLRKRVYDKTVHLGRLPCGDLVLIMARDNQLSTIEARLPWFEIDRHFPLSHQESSPQRRRSEYFPASSYQTPESSVMRNPEHETPRTVSTSASTPPC